MRLIPKRIFGRWLEGIGIGFIAASPMSFKLSDGLFWYWLFAGLICVVIGSYLYEKKID